METASTSLDLILEVSSLADSDIRNLDFDDSINVGANTQSVEVSVHLEPVVATSAILVPEQAPTMDILSTAPLLIPGPSLPPGTRVPITMQGPTFLPISSMPIVFSGALGVPGSMQSAGAPWLRSQATPYPSAFMAPPA